MNIFVIVLHKIKIIISFIHVENIYAIIYDLKWTNATSRSNQRCLEHTDCCMFLCINYKYLAIES